MTRLRFPLLVALAVVVLPVASAEAKGRIDALAVCGVSGCVRVPVPPAVRGGEGFARLVESPIAPAPAPQPYVVLRIRGEGMRWRLFVVGGVATSSSGGWTKLPPPLARAVASAARRAHPIQFRLSVVEVGGFRDRRGQRAADPEAYAPLLHLGGHEVPSSVADANAGHWVLVRFHTARVTPWTSGRPLEGYYDPAARAFTVDGLGWARLSAERAAMIERDAGLGRRAAASESLLPWVALAGLLAAAGAGGRALRARSRRIP
jgi:hypothetical protein